MTSIVRGCWCAMCLFAFFACVWVRPVWGPLFWSGKREIGLGRARVRIYCVSCVDSLRDVLF